MDFTTGYEDREIGLNQIKKNKPKGPEIRNSSYEEHITGL